jgi:hypothetical protein
MNSDLGTRRAVAALVPVGRRGLSPRPVLGFVVVTGPTAGATLSSRGTNSALFANSRTRRYDTLIARCVDNRNASATACALRQ